jgi:hypothetical protein
MIHLPGRLKHFSDELRMYAQFNRMKSSHSILPEILLHTGHQPTHFLTGVNFVFANLSTSLPETHPE